MSQKNKVGNVETVGNLLKTLTEKQKYKHNRMTCRRIIQTGNTDIGAVVYLCLLFRAAMAAGTRLLPKWFIF